jgi:hypothetical protein
MIQHPMCRCCLCPADPLKSKRDEIEDLGSKLAASILLSDTTRRIVVPTHEEWFGLNLLERDDELSPVVRRNRCRRSTQDSRLGKGTSETGSTVRGAGSARDAVTSP